MGSLQLGVYSVFVVILTEYGFRLWRSAVDHFRRTWVPEMSMLRLTLWFLYWAHLVDFSMSRLSWLEFALCVMTTEGMAIALRHFIRMTAPLGNVSAHLFPLFAALAFGFGVHWGASGALGWQGWVSAKLLISLAAVTMLLCWGTQLTVAIVAIVGVEPLERETGNHTGSSEIVGILERLVIFILALSGALAAGLAVAIASIVARVYKRRDEPHLAEYALITTLSSIGIAVGAAYVVRLLPE